MLLLHNTNKTVLFFLLFKGEFSSGELSGTGEVIFASGKCRKCLFKHNGIEKYLSQEEVVADAAAAYMMELVDRKH